MSSQDSGAQHSALQRVLVMVVDEVAGPELIEELGHRLPDVSTAEVMVIAPAVQNTVFRHGPDDADTASRKAKRRLKASMDELSRAGIRARGEIGDSDPLIAVQDALRQFAAGEVLIVAHAESEARWFEEGLFARAQEELRPAVRMIEVPPRS